LFPFGYGLSYTSFSYSNLQFEKNEIGRQGTMRLSCKVKNTGKMAGDEVVQLYIRDEVSSVTTYVKVLRGFERIHLKLGEEKVVDFELTPQDLGLWNKDNHFVVEPGRFSVMIGSSSEDIRLQGHFFVK
jgi:beta-glucosidase